MNDDWTIYSPLGFTLDLYNIRGLAHFRGGWIWDKHGPVVVGGIFEWLFDDRAARDTPSLVIIINEEFRIYK